LLQVPYARISLADIAILDRSYKTLFYVGRALFQNHRGAQKTDNYHRLKKHQPQLNPRDALLANIKSIEYDPAKRLKKGVVKRYTKKLVQLYKENCKQ
jgi:hypothetical protein